jgi:CheY-like chemotaxis protein
MISALAGARPFTLPLRILLAEENGGVRRLLGLALHDDGHEVFEARDGGELLAALASSLVDDAPAPFDLVICEQRLHGVQGLTVLAALRADHSTMRFVLICGDEATRRRARRLGGVVLDHPLSRAAVRAAIRTATAARPMLTVV